MIEKSIKINNKVIFYNLIYKNVKNVNLRIKPDGTVNISANKYVPLSFVENFIISKSDFILNSLDKFSGKYSTSEPVQYFSENDIRNIVTELCNKAYVTYFERLGIKYPHIRFRRMISRWGSCHPQKNILTFNLNLKYAPEECIEYVVFHEFTHFLQANHSKKFYEELEKAYPGWKECRKKMKDIYIP